MPNPPSQEVWMQLPAQTGPANVPSGLLYLTTLNKLLVRQKVELLEALTGFETSNKYTIKNNDGQNVYYAVEDTDCCTRMCCGPQRPFEIKVLDIYKNEIIHLSRDLALNCLCFPCCLQKLEVQCPPGNLVGTVEQVWTFCAAKFDIKNEMGITVLKIEGPALCACNCCGDVDFDILTPDGSKVGKISKQWSGLLREAFTDSDFFGISFPLDLDVRMKAVMIGACFLIDFMYFESSS